MKHETKYEKREPDYILMYQPHKPITRKNDKRIRMENQRVEHGLPTCHATKCMMVRGTRCTECSLWWAKP